MSYTVVFQGESERFEEEFLSLSKRLYSREEIMQNESEERALLSGSHLLSHYFSLKGLMVVRDDGQAICRCAVTIYPEDETAYLGLFESEDNSEAVRLMLSAAEEIARKSGAKRFAGPIDGSFWIKYRMKTNRFGVPYTGEPYNLSYYPKLWEQCGFQVSEQYFSNHYAVVRNEVDSEKFTNRLKDKLTEGYSIESVNRKNLDQVLREVYGMLIELYSRFPAYKRITEEEFIGLYGYFKHIIRRNMVKMAYYQGKPAGFFISVPDYGNIIYKRLSLLGLLRIFRIRLNPSAYIMLYMGVEPSHRGLGKALAESIREELRREGVPSVGALIRKGNCNKDYFSSLVDYEYEYALLEKEL